MRIERDESMQCPLLGREIAEGYCLDLNYQWRGMFKPDVLAPLCRATGITVQKVEEACRRCPNQPLPVATSEASN